MTHQINSILFHSYAISNDVKEIQWTQSRFCRQQCNYFNLIKNIKNALINYEWVKGYTLMELNILGISSDVKRQDVKHFFCIQLASET